MHHLTTYKEEKKKEGWKRKSETDLWLRIFKIE